MVEVNGKSFTRESVRAGIQKKRVVLWMDWLVTDQDQMEQAIDWFMDSVNELATT